MPQPVGPVPFIKINWYKMIKFRQPVAEPKPIDAAAASLWPLENLKDASLQGVEKALHSRTTILARSAAALQRLDYEKDDALRLAATDLFVEKAQDALTRRAKTLYRSGVALAGAAILALGFAIWFAITRLHNPSDDGDLSNQALILAVFQALALSGFVFATIKYLIALSRSFFHEATSLLERRHALRFGRLWAYQTVEPIKLSELIEAFNWNKQSTSAFLDIRPEVITRTLIHDIVDAVGKMPAESIDKLIESMKLARGAKAEVK